VAAGNPISSRTSSALAWFALVAGCGWLLDAACLLTFARFVPAGLANVASSLTAATFVYLVAHRFVHQGRPALIGLRLAMYGVYTLALIFVASIGLARIAAAIGPYAPRAVAILAAKVFITPPQFLCNFVMSRFLARAEVVRA
jgi:putative flippase GtrA